MDQGLSAADILFENQRQRLILESDLSDLFEKFSRNFDWADFSYDYYDYSLEIFGVPDHYKLTGSDLQMLIDYGFDIVWTHKVAKKSDYTSNAPNVREKEGERFYKLH